MTVFELKDQHRILNILHQRYSQHANFNKLTPTIPYFKPEEISELLNLKKHYSLRLLAELEKKEFVSQMSNDSINYIITEKGIGAVNQKRLINEAKSKYNQTSRILIEFLILMGGVVAAYVILSE